MHFVKFRAPIYNELIFICKPLKRQAQQIYFIRLQIYFEASVINSVDLGPHCLPIYVFTMRNKHTFSNAVILLAF